MLPTSRKAGGLLKKHGGASEEEERVKLSNRRDYGYYHTTYRSRCSEWPEQVMMLPHYSSKDSSLSDKVLVLLFHLREMHTIGTLM